MPNGKEIVDVVVGETRTTADIKFCVAYEKNRIPSKNFKGTKLM